MSTIKESQVRFGRSRESPALPIDGMIERSGGVCQCRGRG
jgi:hypothetical protein